MHNMIVRIFLFFSSFVLISSFLTTNLTYSYSEPSFTSSVLLEEKQEKYSQKDIQLWLASSEEREEGTREPISLFWLIPFIAILLTIAIVPLISQSFWHKNYWKVSIFIFALPMFFISLFAINDVVRDKTLHEVQSYISFILLLASLFTISGAIYIRGNFVGTPLFNTVVLIIGTVLASFMGTTGASMLLIHLLIRANKYRNKKSHIILFFIFTVSNSGGLLTPLGDPPLFLGFLRGVPFTWTLNLIPQWLFMNGILLAIFFIWDWLAHKKEETPKNTQPKERFRIEGGIQFLFLLGVMLSIYFQGHFLKLAKEDPSSWGWWPSFGFQEVAMLIFTGISLWVAGTKSDIRKANEFTWFPIKEVAALFAGIFACMVPALYIIELYGKDTPLTEAWHFFWVTGTISAFLDNAPAYLVYFQLAQSKLGVDVVGLIDQYKYLAAISCGAVFMGAMSYIGNAPNFMVRSIAVHNKVPMPSFFGYMAYSIAILIPVLILLTFVFF